MVMPIVTPARESPLTYLAVLLCACSWLIPDHYPPWKSFYSDCLAFAGLLMLSLFVAGSARSGANLPVVAVVVVTLAAIPATQATSGLIFFSGDGWMAAAYLAGLSISISAGHVIAQSGREDLANALAWLFVASAGVSALLVVHQVLDLDALGVLIVPLSEFDHRPYANLAQPNQLATLLCWGLMGLLYLHSRARIHLAALLGLGGLLILGVVLTQSRAPWLGAAALVVWWLLKRKTIPQVRGWPIALGLALYAGLILFWPETSISRAEKSLAPAISMPAQRTDLADPGTHLQNWQEMTRAILKQPWTGYGWNQVSVAHVQNAHERHTYAELLSHSHNLLLDLLVWNGLPLGLLIIGLLAVWLATRAWRCRSPESWFAFAVMGFIGAHSLVEYPLEYAYFLLPVGLLAGLVEADDGQGRTLRVPAAVPWAAVVLGAVFMVWVWIEYRIVEEDYRLMRFETRNIGPLKAAQPAPDIVLLTQLREDLRMARSQARPGMSEAELAWMRKVTYRYPYYSNLFRYSVSLALNDRRDEASIEFRRLYDIYGARPYAQAKQGVAWLTQNRYPQLADWQLPAP